MLYKYIIGTVTVKIQGFDLDKLCNEIASKCKVLMLCKESDCLIVKLSWLDRNKLMVIINDNSCVYEVLSEKGLFRYIYNYRHRYGLIVGAVLVLILTIFLSNFAIRIDFIFEGDYDEDISDDVTSLLESRGLTVGTYLPNVDFRSLNADIASQFDNISFLSIGNKGPVVLVNIGLSPDKAEFQEKRMPSNIIAERDGVIVMPIVLSGELSVLIGDAVSEGELLVSGIVDSRNGKTYYYHSIGEIIAEFEEEYILRQSFVDVTQTYGKAKTVYSISLFDLNIPFGIVPKGNYIESYKDIIRLGSFGAIEKHEFRELTEDIIDYTEESARYELNRRIETLEESTLSDYEILSREISETVDESGITYLIKYKLKGDIGKQQPIFAK